ncbi:MAG TPA: DUF4352 domain-containing protein [Conexibacter sp.]|jgi:hypothetical protein
MKKTIPLSLLVVLGVAGCGGSTTTIIQTVQVPATTADTVATTPEATATATATATTADETPPPKPHVPTVGDALTLKGSDVTMRVKLLGVVDPATAGEYDTVDGRLVGVRLKMTNVGDRAYDDAPSNGVELITRDDEQSDSTLVSGGNCAGSFSSSTKIAPGSARVGCIAFDVPSGKQLKTFQLTLDSGFAAQTGEWRIVGAASSGAPADDASEPPASSAPADDDSEPPPSSADNGADGASVAMTACDSNISVDPRSTTCPFANNVFWEYWTGGQVAPVSAWSSALQRYVDVTCQSGTRVVCSGVEGSRVSFPEAAVEAYSQSQATAYASSHEVGP